MSTDIPTEQLRALVAVVDFGSYTKAAQFLGITQPSVSTQLKRLQELLGTELFDKRGQGVRLTQAGEVALNYARRMLSINDQLLRQIKPRQSVATLKIGVPSDLVEAMFPSVLAEFRRRSPGLRFHFRLDISENLLLGLRQSELDVVVALTNAIPALEAHRYWAEEVVWVCAPATSYDPSGPVPLVTYTEHCVYTRLAMSALNQAGRDYEVVFTGTGKASLIAAVSAGLGVMVLARRAVPPELLVSDTPTLPRLGTVVCGIYLRQGEDRQGLERLADDFAEIINPPLGA